MQDKELAVNLIDTFAILQRIVNCNDSKKEAEYQLQLVKAKLEAMGIVTSELHIGEIP